ncbi:hypothetical protein [Desulforamulus aquiferis]|uniref:Paeninodin family lasso peptide n=1 Tax=Desulforamulus aquiferis TaxID=1397668 RepID=A0AAW7ZF75_9FIRM|nr:hypothetical protein [Desulforamulus aquiferis]MDO7788449.1 hypothetical protein [Desulforamulus aquiferis]
MKKQWIEPKIVEIATRKTGTQVKKGGSGDMDFNGVVQGVLDPWEDCCNVCS